MVALPIPSIPIPVRWVTPCFGWPGRLSSLPRTQPLPQYKLWVVNSRLYSSRPPLFDPSPYILASLLPYLLVARHRDGKSLTASPLESALTYRDACNPFRFRSYKNCRVSPATSCSSFFRPSLPASNQPLSSLSFQPLTNCKFCNSFVLKIHTNCLGSVPLLPFAPFISLLTFRRSKTPDFSGSETPTRLELSTFLRHTQYFFTPSRITEHGSRPTRRGSRERVR